MGNILFRIQMKGRNIWNAIALIIFNGCNLISTYTPHYFQNSCFSLVVRFLFFQSFLETPQTRHPPLSLPTLNSISPLYSVYKIKSPLTTCRVFFRTRCAFRITPDMLNKHTFKHLFPSSSTSTGSRVCPMHLIICNVAEHIIGVK